MSMNILAILISLAMMLTGAGGEGQPAEASRMMMIHNVNLTYNDQSVTLDPALWMGAYANGEKALFDLSVQMDNDSLFPMQVSVDDSGITALFENSDVAVKVSADALNALSEQASQSMEALQAQMAGGENAELMTFIMQEFIPAYTGLLSAVQDPEFVKELEAQGNAVFAEVVDRGEGTPLTAEIDGTEYALNEYTYTITSEQMAELCDKLFNANDALKNYYDAMFKLYSLMPEESGLNKMTSFQDLFSATGMNLTMDVTEQLSDDEVVDRMDAVMTLDMSGMMAAIAAQNGGTEAPADVQIPPIVMNISSSKAGDVKDASVSCEYQVDADGQSVGFDMTMTAHTEGEENISLDMTMNMTQNGSSMGSMFMNASKITDAETGDGTHSFGYTIDAQGMYASLLNSGLTNADGTSTNNVMFSMNGNGTNMSVSFDVDVQAGELGDLTEGHEVAVTIDDLSQEAMNALGEDQAFQGAMMQVAGSLTTDGQKLMANESVQQLMSIFTAVPVADADYTDDSFDGADVEDYEYEEPVDDGELGFDVPEFTWLPEGWTQQDSEVNTQYDYVSLSYGTEDFSNSLYATFYKNEDNNTINYVVGGDGEIEAVDGREISVSDFGDGNVSVTVREDDIEGNLNIFSADIDVETIGKIVAGLQF